MTTRSWKAVLVATGIAISLEVVGPLAQTLVVTPNCGEAGKTTVCVTGSGWAEPVPVCRYKFFFDGTQVAPDQPDGLFGPPNRTFVVPAGKAPGTYPVRVELRLNNPDSLLQVREQPFKVVAALKEPWTVTTTGARIDIKFDPTDVCDVTPCTKLVFIQVDRRVGIKDDGTEVAEPDSNWGFPAAGDADLTAGKYIVDRIIGKTEPYYGGNGAGTGASTPGSNVVTPNTAATMRDIPSQSDGTFPAGFKAVRLEFETAAFCASGDDRGRYFGRVFWKWEKAKGAGAGTSTFISSDRNQPSATFLDALSIWIKNHSYSQPTATTVTCS
jgi:hypothetical protein